MFEQKQRCFDFGFSWSGSVFAWSYPTFSKLLGWFGALSLALGTEINDGLGKMIAKYLAKSWDLMWKLVRQYNSPPHCPSSPPQIYLFLEDFIYFGRPCFISTSCDLLLSESKALLKHSLETIALTMNKD